ncbi:MAG TPA: hypothetical protein VD860_17565 [Azospirillum sp.]|nr:hypothetical protein [Azospirillum sp.]
MDAPRLHALPDLARFVATKTTPGQRPSLGLPIVRDLAARALAQRGGAPDDVMVERLRAHDRLVAAWVAHHGIQPELACGATIRVLTNDRAWNRVEVEGEIVGIDLAHGKYRVFSEALGHVRSGPGPRFRAIPYEDVRPAGAAGARAAA